MPPQVGRRAFEAGEARVVTVSRSYDAPLDDVHQAAGLVADAGEEGGGLLRSTAAPGEGHGRGGGCEATLNRAGLYRSRV
ncbi:hypothetical protein ACIRPX_02240 [Streptomyces sp. NPDC101225]|uniref:hypothetical protein n=1 Tax=Streptomyces sp. NPDC101225 TaxID=3366135 RepID=UPI0037F80EE2